MPLAAAAPIPFQNCPTCLGGGGGGGAPVNLNDLTDVVLTGPLSVGSALVYNGATWVNLPNTLDNLVDTTIGVPVDGHVLTYDSATGQWVNEPPVGQVLSFFHTQTVAATTWTITHGLTFIPAGIHIEDTAGNDIDPANVTFTASQVVVQFLAAQAGTARVS